MARASVHLIKSDARPSSFVGHVERPRAFAALEAPIEDIRQMALIANDKIFDVIGDLTIRDGFAADGNTISEGQITAAMFAVSHLVTMIQNLQAEYNAA